MIAGRYFSGMLIATMFVCLGQAAAATVTSTLRVTAITVQSDEQARAVLIGEDEGDFDPNKLPPTASGPESFGKIQRFAGMRIQLTSGYPVHILLEGITAKQWEYVFETESVVLVRRRSDAAYSMPSGLLSVGVSY